jgi:carbonic anhydrase
VRQNVDTVCFVSERWDSLGDDATEEETKTWKPKPGYVRIGCTDRRVFEPIDKRKDR